MKNKDNIMNAIKFMDNNLTRKITSEQIAFHSTYSVYHFSRVFIDLTGMSPGEYLRRRRLTQAAKDILYGNKEIMQTALDYQFSTQEGFTRAFKDYFGITPGRCRLSRNDISNKFVTELSAQKITDSFTKAILSPTIKEIGEIKLAGISIFTKDKNEIKEAWRIFLKSIGKIRNCSFFSEACSNHGFGLECYNDDFFESGKFFYMPSVQIDSFDDLPVEMSLKIIPPSKYAVFTHKGIPSAISETITAAYEKWIPESGYKADRSYDFEFYDDRFKPDSEDSEIDIYIPIK
ncbi:MAG TPA: AraC family transcriptional regulator [Spirochaetota bacterium]|nr:AraC family transcriptional regulator [Spirochaetota bacterium]